MYIYQVDGTAVQITGWFEDWAITISEYNGLVLIPPWNIVSFNELWRLK